MEYGWKKAITLLGLLVFLLCVWLVISGQKSIGYPGLGLMLLGLAGILGCIWVYNRTHR